MPKSSSEPGNTESADKPQDSEFVAAFREASERMGLGALATGDPLTPKALVAAVGGVRGIIESLLPGVVFLVVYTITRSVMGLSSQEALLPALAGSVGLAVIFTVVRLVTRTSPVQAIAGLVLTLISAAFALWTGNAADNFVLGFWIDGVLVVGFLISIIVRWPILGLILGALLEGNMRWRNDRAKYRLAVWLTLAWTGLFFARLAVQLPLYLISDVVALGVARLVMGLPLYALLIVVTWLVARGRFGHTNATTLDATDKPVDSRSTPRND